MRLTIGCEGFLFEGGFNPMEELTREEFQAKVRAIAAFMPGWSYEEPGENTSAETLAGLLGPSGMRITISRYWNDHATAHASGCYPRGHDGAYRGARGWGAIHYDAKEPECGFSLSKTPERIASDLRRRLLPIYAEVYALCIQAQKREAEYHATLAANVERLAGILGAEVKESNLDGGEFCAQLGDRRIKARVSEDSVALEIDDLTIDQGIDVCRVLKTFPVELTQ